MTEPQLQHLGAIESDIRRDLNKKYRQGQAEHGGNLWEKPALPEAIAEVVDLVTYVYTLRHQFLIYKKELDLALDQLKNGRLEGAVFTINELKQLIEKQL